MSVVPCDRLNTCYRIVRSAVSTLFALVSNVGLECFELNLQLGELSLSSRALALVDGDDDDNEADQSTSCTRSRYHDNRPLVLLTVRLHLLILQLTERE